MDNVCNRRLFSFPAEVEMAEEQEYLRTMDTKSQPQKENSYKLNPFIADTPMMTVLIQHDFLFVVTYQSVISSLIVHTITVSFVFNQYTSKTCLGQFWLKEHLIPSMEPLK